MELKSYYKYVNTLDIKIPKIQPSSLSSNQNIPSWPSRCMLLHLHWLPGIYVIILSSSPIFACQNPSISMGTYSLFSYIKKKLTIFCMTESPGFSYMAMYLTCFSGSNICLRVFFVLMGVTRISTIEHTSWYPGWIIKNIQ
jgi:hypothetical protein